MKKKLTNNWGLKLISVFLAVILWLFVCNQVNPVVTRTVTVRNVEYLNEDVVIDSDLTYTVEALDGAGIDVEVPVHKTDVNKVRASDFEIQIDLSKIGPFGTVEVNIVWLNPGTYTLEGDLSWKTTTVDVSLESILTNTYPVTITLEGEPADGYIIGDDVQISERSVKIKAPESVMAQIHSAGIVVDVSGQSSDMTGTEQLLLYGVSGEPLELDTEHFEEYEFSLSVSEVDYFIPMLKTKEVNITVEGTEGEVAEGCRFTDVLKSVQTVNIAGMRAVLADVDAIVIPSSYLNLDGADENVEITVDLSGLLPEGVTIEGNSEVVITLVVEPLITQVRELEAEMIRIEDQEDGWDYQIDGSAFVTLEGLEEDLATVSNQSLDPRISVAGLSEGENTVQVEVTASNGFTVISAGTVTVTRTPSESPESETESSETE